MIDLRHYCTHVIPRKREKNSMLPADNIFKLYSMALIEEKRKQNYLAKFENLSFSVL